ncbi:MAG: DUF4191 domain-containing protein [Propionibacteriaceae bacterium]|nr:DUF4191 domain-containing protein [Propionibacteriaceae bacterium]
MARSERAKEFAAKQKADAKAAKQAKKTSNDPKDWGRMKQLRETLKITLEVDPAAKWWIFGAAGITLAVFVVLSFFLTPFWMWLILGVGFALIAAMFMLTDRAKKSTYKRFKGQPGSAEVALGMLNKKQWTYTSPITVNKQMDVVHRVVGKAGILLIGEGSAARLKPMLSSEQKRHEQIAYQVPVTTILMGNDAGQVPLEKLENHIKKLPKTIRPLQINEVKKRLQALDSVRQMLPMPKGPMVMPKGANKAMRGR